MTTIKISPIPERAYGDFGLVIRDLCNMKYGPWVAGGSVRKVWANKPWATQDVDFFFASREQCNGFKDRMSHYAKFRDNGFHTNNASSYILNYPRRTLVSRAMDWFKKEPIEPTVIKIQAIHKQFYGSPQEIIDDFDMTVSQFVTDGRTIMHTDAAEQDCRNGTFHWNPRSNKKLNAYRVLKYAAYGFEPSDDLLLRAAEMIKNGTSDGPNDY